MLKPLPAPAEWVPEWPERKTLVALLSEHPGGLLWANVAALLKIETASRAGLDLKRALNRLKEEGLCLYHIGRYKPVPPAELPATAAKPSAKPPADLAKWNERELLGLFPFGEAAATPHLVMAKRAMSAMGMPSGVFAAFRTNFLFEGRIKKTGSAEDLKYYR
jgi:hypothetical protein